MPHPVLVLVLLSCASVCIHGVRREYFLRIDEVNWNYAPSGMNLIQNRTIQEDEEAAVFLKKGPQRIGSTYKKAIYKQFSDATYTTEVIKPAWLGYLGPRLMAEEGDTLIVHLKNMASRPYSIHPHGLNYSKGSEGALYPDGTTSEMKRDDSVAPGTTVTYMWTLPHSHSPKPTESNCLTRFYHSHVLTPKDINSGLIGPLVICRKGTLDVHGVGAAEYRYALIFLVSDENFSWYLDENIRTHITNPARGLKEDEDFIESNKMHGINGFLYGNLPGLSMCQGSKIHWHMIGLGNEVDMHSVHFHGQILTSENHHTDTISLFPGSSATADMVADNPGHWLLTCTVNDHLMGGMQAIFEIRKCFPNVHKPRPHGQLREFFIAAEEEIWDYAPILPTDSEADMFVTRGRNRIGSRYKKVRYVEYTDSSFLTKMLRSPEEQHLGILGPVLRAEEKDTIKVVFKNKASRPYSIQPHGVEYSIEQDGTLYHNELEESYTAKKLRELKHEQRTVTPPPAALVTPGKMHTYEWVVPVGAGPVQGEADCLTYLYYSAVDPVKDTNSGLVGPMLVCRPNSLKKGIQKNYNKEFHLLATVFDENLSWYLDDSIRAFATAAATVKEDEGFIESNKMHSINGFVYGNLQGLTMCKGDKVTWHLSGLGSETDINSLYFNGNRFIFRQNRLDAISVFPHISHTVTMEPDSMGQFEVASPMVNNYRGGMRANYTVQKCSFMQRQGETMLHFKTYYIAAMEMDWDYSPNRTWEAEMFRGQQSPASVFLDQSGGFIGSRYKKVVYRQFTNEKFNNQMERGSDMEHLGIMGPMIHANVGDKVKVVFKNMASRSYSIHAHGVKTENSNVYHTKPGETHTYEWYVTKNTGPTAEQEECSVSAYYSTVDVVKDLYSGLIGPLVICRRSLARSLGLKKEIEEFALLMMVFDENESWYLDENIRTHIRNPRPNLKDDEDFIESNKMHAINGFVYANLNGLNMEVGDKVYWYLMGMGNEVDIHGVHWHGHSVEYKLSGGPHTTDVFQLFPATFQTVKMRPQYPGTWMVHCHVTDHIKAGTIAMYTVREKVKKRGFTG
ncbi:ceruloplasmin [Corythoichthys intestinalis]|uniref:ceruloplasmin n=1 Tax=Corythoichthys intestinalis TaxID=161448 RepID=UPI0025A681CE|nr:ceruloplasmin [Corythoichthys intestinalis]XP_061791040.1 ceruloplasmin-like [Nerophis lumbriciformis]